MIQILKASAGSGKTHRLTQTYIDLLLREKDPYSYRHILAVTFTNKATEEMKGRILSELFTLSNDAASSPYYAYLLPKFASEQELAKTASVVLCNILHDYGSFAVSTIDKFFQQVLRAFSRELGIYSSYQVELNKDVLISESVDKVLDSIGKEDDDERKRKWLVRNALQRLSQGESINLERGLLDLAKQILSEAHRSALEALGLGNTELYDIKAVSALEKCCKDFCKSYLKKLSEAAKAIAVAADKAGIDLKDTYYKFLDVVVSKFANISDDGRFEEIFKNAKIKVAGELASSEELLGALCGSYFLQNYASVDLWFTKPKAKLAAKVTPELKTAVDDFADLFGSELILYRTAKLLEDQVYGFGLSGDLDKAFKEVLKEENVLSLEESTALLRKIIDDSDAPFIYERTGVRYEHFLLDEFQDTSHIQWENFRPLLSNSVSQGFDNLVVGDVKQSIYRFRDSDWNILKDEISRDFQVKEDVLDSNWRSSREIIEFNNSFFALCAAQLERQFGTKYGSLGDIYSDLEQKPAPKKTPGGRIKVHFGASADEPSEVFNAIVSAVEEGYHYGDIGVLVRKNEHGAMIAQYLIENGVPVVTDESLEVKSSSTVANLLALLSSIDNPKDKLSLYLTSEMGVQIPNEYHSLVDLCESLLRELKKLDPEKFSCETLYIQSFMDKASDFQNKNRGGLHEFLELMKEDDSSINSPSVGDCVRIMTIHKSKGLAFQVVIAPYLEKVTLWPGKPIFKWCHPTIEGTPLEDAAKGVFNIKLVKDISSTFFASEFRKEQFNQCVDAINLAYVAFTRAKHRLILIGERPKAKFANDLAQGNPTFDNFSQLLYAFVCNNDQFTDISRPVECYEDGTPCEDDPGIDYVFPSEPPKEKVVSDYSCLDSGFEDRKSEYISQPIGDRLTFGRESRDFFKGDKAATSKRLRGIVLHDIMSKVYLPSDLPAAVQAATDQGRLTPEQEQEALELLSSAIEEHLGDGWFPLERSRVWNETSLLDTDGNVYRPDRVVELEDGYLMVIDYKFGPQRPKYQAQVEEYMSLLSRMGYSQVRGALWYVDSGKVVSL